LAALVGFARNLLTGTERAMVAEQQAALESNEQSSAEQKGG